MGSGASPGLQAAVQAASPEEMSNVAKQLPPDLVKKLAAALGSSGAGGWVEEFVICGALACKDIPKVSELTMIDADIQMKKEPRAPRFAVMGVTTGESPAMSKDKLCWLASFECMEAWGGPEHKEREGNKEFTQALFGSGMSGDMLKDMDGGYTGPVWHLEKPGCGAQSGVPVFAALTRVKAKDAAAADKVVELMKELGPAQLNAEPGALRITLMRTANMVGPLPKDDVTVQWIEAFKTAGDYATHKEASHVKDAMSKIKALLGEDMVTCEFADTKHFAQGRGWLDEFVICGQFSCKDIPKVSELTMIDADIQMKKEPRAPRFAVMGVATGETPALPKDKICWLAEFECMEAWAGPEHKEREGNKEFTQAVFSNGSSGDMLKDMDGGYTGPVWHLEKPGFGGQSGVPVFAVYTRVKAKDAAAADKVVELMKELGPAQLNAETGALRITLMRTANMVGPLPKDDITGQWIEAFKTAGDYATHKEASHVKDAMSKIKALLVEDMMTCEFADTKHFAK